MDSLIVRFWLKYIGERGHGNCLPEETALRRATSSITSFIKSYEFHYVVAKEVCSPEAAVSVREGAL